MKKPQRFPRRFRAVLAILCAFAVVSSACTLRGAAQPDAATYEDSISSLLESYVDEMNGLNALLKTTDVTNPVWQANASGNVGQLLASAQALRALEVPPCFASNQRELLLGLDAVDAALGRFLDGIKARDGQALSSAVRSLATSVLLVNAAIDSLMRTRCQ